MAITAETKQVVVETKYRVRRIEIIADYNTALLDRVILLEVEKVSVLDGVAVGHNFVKNVIRKISDIAHLIDPSGTSAMQAMGMLLWDNDVQAQKVLDDILNPPVEEVVVPFEPVSEEATADVHVEVPAEYIPDPSESIPPEEPAP